MLSVLVSLISGSRKPMMSGDSAMGSKSKAKTDGYTNAFMEPSSIHPIYSGKSNILTVDIHQDIAEISRKIVETGKLPKLQVVEKNGNWFTLNNSQLDLCRVLQKDGKCSKVKVDIVPLSSVPRVLRGMMVIPEEKDTPQPGSSDPSRTTTKGYERLDQTDGAEGAEAEQISDTESNGEEDSSSESSDYVESDSECDWSDDEQESSEVESSGSDEDQSTDDERECLL